MVFFGEHVRRYAMVRSFVSCVKSRVALRQNSKGIQLLSAIEPLEFVAADILGQLPATKRGKRFLLVIIDLFS